MSAASQVEGDAPRWLERACGWCGGCHRLHPEAVSLCAAPTRLLLRGARTAGRLEEALEASGDVTRSESAWQLVCSIAHSVVLQPVSCLQTTLSTLARWDSVISGPFKLALLRERTSVVHASADIYHDPDRRQR